MFAYTCTCAAGYTDTPVSTCYLALDECASDLCLHAATCCGHACSYSCVCARGYSGYNYEINDNDCIPLPCKNGATCTDLVDNVCCHVIRRALRRGGGR